MLKHLPSLLALLMLIAAADARSQWVQTNGPNQGTVSSLGVDGQNLVAGSSAGGIFFSTNNGMNWKEAFGSRSFEATAIATAGTNIFAAGGGVLLSIDSGVSWVERSDGLPHNAISSMLANGTDLFVGTKGAGIFHSTNNGLTWSPSNHGFPTIESVNCLATSGTRMFACTSDSGMYSSSDNGADWRRSSSGLPYDTMYHSYRPIFASISEGTNLLTGTANGVFISTDDGTHWSASSDGLPSSLKCYALLTSGGSIYLGTTEGAFRSLDSGSTWSLSDSGITGGVTELTVISTNLIAGSTDGLYLSSDGGFSWRTITTGLPANADVYNMAIIGNDLFALGYGDLGSEFYRSSDQGKHWEGQFIDPHDGNLISLATDSSHLYAATFDPFIGADIFRSSDMGSTWISAGNGLPRTYLASTGLEEGSVAKAVAAVGTNLFAGTDSGVCISPDSGNNWFPVFAPFPGVFLFAVSGVNLFAVANSDGLQYIAVTTNNGNSWSVINSSLSAEVGAFALSDRGILVGDGFFGTGVFSSSNNGASWISLDSGLPYDSLTGRYPLCTCLAPLGPHLLLSTNTGVYVSNDTPIYWLPEGSGLGSDSTAVTAFAFDGVNVFAGTNGNGIFRRPISELTSPLSIVAIVQPIRGDLSTFPNPFSQSTTIDFTARTAGYASVSIVNTLGTEVARLFSGELSPGAHRFTWNDPAVPDGMYECVVRMNGVVQHAEVVLMR